MPMNDTKMLLRTITNIMPNTDICKVEVTDNRGSDGMWRGKVTYEGGDVVLCFIYENGEVDVYTEESFTEETGRMS